MEHKIGEIFEYNSKWYQCLENNSHCCGCEYCDFGELGDCDIIACSSSERNDNKEVYFKKFEKAGEPVTVKGRTFQKLILNNCSCANCVFNVQNKECNKNSYIDGLCPDDEIWVEIKQNKEDMEEYRIHDAKEDIPEFDKVVDECLFGEDKLNLKPFDIETAKVGKTVCTRDRRKVRIICFDMNSFNNHIIVALITEKNGTESIYSYTSEGKWKETETENDLMILPEKKEGWAKVRKDINLYDTKEEADRKMIGNDEYITAKVCWEE